MPFLRRRRPGIAALFLLAFFASERSLGATPNEELSAARETFAEGRYQRAIPLFSGLLYPQSRLADASLLAEAHLLLGVSYFEVGQRDAAQREFEEALFLDSNLILDSSLFSAEAIRFFDATKEDLTQRMREADEGEAVAREREKLRRKIENLVIFEKRRYFVNFIPFGAGQFQNDEKSKGAFFFISEALTGGSSAALWSYQVIRYGLAGRVPIEEVSRVRAIQAIQITTGAVFFGLMAWGIIDSLAHFEHAIQRQPDPRMLRELELDAPGDDEISLRLLPYASPGGGGLSLFWEF